MTPEIFYSQMSSENSTVNAIGIRRNLVPLYQRFNQILHVRIEREIVGLANEGKKVEYTVVPTYGTHPSIPIELSVIAKVDGIEAVDVILHNAP